MKRTLMTAVLFVTLAGSSQAYTLKKGPAFSGLENAADQAAHGSPGAAFDNNTRPGAPPQVAGYQAHKAVARGLAVTAPAPVEAPESAGESGNIGSRAINQGCDGFFSCVGGGIIGAVTLPILTPIATTVGGAAIGATFGGVAGGIGGGLLGLIAGVVLGVILAPIALISGIFQGLGKLFQGKP